MEFSVKKMTRETATKLRRCPVESISPYALMICPVYVWFNRNKKFLAVKAPLDFFTPEELARYRERQNFFMPEFVDQVVPFQSAGQSVKAVLSWVPKGEVRSGVGEGELYPEVPLPITPYEASDAILRILGPLWTPGLTMEPFFLAALVGEICAPIPGELLQIARDRSIDGMETAILQSSFVVLMALLMGRVHLPYLIALRNGTFAQVSQGRAKLLFEASGDETLEMLQLAQESLPHPRVQTLSGAFFRDRPERVAHKITDRLIRIEKELVKETTKVASIFGPKGFCDA